jgi:2-oxoglutarate ferredoxin oxidoreductase subunit alpha
VPPPVIQRRQGAEIGIVTVGGCDAAVREAIDILATPSNGHPALAADYMRIRGFPFDESVDAFLDEHEVCFVVEQNRDAQLRSLLVLESRARRATLRSVLVYGGFPLSARHVVDGIMSQRKE